MKRKKIARIENRLVLGSLLLVLAVMAAERFPGERWWPSLLLVYSPQQVWAAPAALLALYLFLRGRWVHAVGAAAVTAVAAVSLLGAPLPGLESKARSDLRVLTWNMYWGRGGRALPELFAQTLPDALCLQEANPWGERQLDELLRRPQFRGWDAKVCGELVILSRFPMKRLGTTHSALWASLDVDGREIVVASVHLDKPYSPRLPQMSNPDRLYAAQRLRDKQIRQIIDRLPKDRPVIVCGDFNTPPNTRNYRRVTSVLTDSFRECGSGLGLTYQTRRPLVRIDHIFVSRDLTPVRCWLPPATASNHRPVCADLRMTNEE